MALHVTIWKSVHWRNVGKVVIIITCKLTQIYTICQRMINSVSHVKWTWPCIYILLPDFNLASQKGSPCVKVMWNTDLIMSMGARHTCECAHVQLATYVIYHTQGPKGTSTIIIKHTSQHKINWNAYIKLVSSTSFFNSRFDKWFVNFWVIWLNHW